MGKNVDCTVVILSFNTRTITDTCIRKAEHSARYCQKKLQNNVSIIVVDNASQDGTVESITKNHKNVRLIAMKKNVGVAKGYNEGMKAAKTPFILIINSDAYLNEDTLYKSLLYMQEHPSCGALMAKVLNAKDQTVAYGGHLPTPLNTISWLLGLESMPFVKRHIKRIYTYNKDFYQNEGIMEWVPTCFLFLRKEVYQQTKGHDEKMFLYMEDVEWCKRIHDSGFTICYNPKITATHLGGESTAKKLDYSYLLTNQTKGMKFYHKKHYPTFYPVILVFLYLGFSLRAMLYWTKGENVIAKAYLRALTTQ